MYNCIFIMCYLLLRLGEEGQLRLPCLNNKQYTTQNTQYEHKNTLNTQCERDKCHFPANAHNFLYVIMFSVELSAEYPSGGNEWKRSNIWITIHNIKTSRCHIHMKCWPRYVDMLCRPFWKIREERCKCALAFGCVCMVEAMKEVFYELGFLRGGILGFLHYAG